MDSNSPPSQGLSAHTVIDSAFVAGTSSSPEGPEAAGSHPIENIAHHATPILPYPCCGSHEQRGVHNAPRPETAAQECAKVAQKYDEGVCKDWKEEIDTLMVFAGLFSAVTTAFLIDSYKWLLSNAATTDSDTTFFPTRVKERINAYWFLSLILALSAASTGMLCKQWLREYIRDSGRSSKDALCVRQLRLEGLSAWKVAAIISTIPLLLQVALILFFIGMMELLWCLDKTVAISLTIIAAFMIFFLLFTTLAPSIQYCSVVLRRSLDLLPPQCPYKSPQSWLLVNLLNRVFCSLTSLRHRIFHRRGLFFRIDVLGPKLTKRFSSWSKYDLSWVKDNADTDALIISGPAVEHYLGRSIAWLMLHFDSPDLQSSLYYLFWNSIQTYDQRTQVPPPDDPPPDDTNFCPPFWRERRLAKSSNLDLIVSLCEDKSDELLFEAAERTRDGFHVSGLVPKIGIVAYSEWAACSWDTRYKSRCNAEFTAAYMCYLSGQNGLIGLQHCLQLIKGHLTHPDPNDYKFVIPPGVHAPFNAHISAVTASAEISHASVPAALEESLCDCARLILSKRSFHVTPLLDEEIQQILRFRTDPPFNHLNNEQIAERMIESIFLTMTLYSYIPGLPSYTLPYVPQIVRFLLKRATILQARSPYFGTLVVDMELYLKDALHPSRPGMTEKVRRDHIRAFMNLTIQELHKPLTAEPTDTCHLDLHLYPEIFPFIQRLRNLAALLDVSEERIEWHDILQSCGLVYTPSDFELLEEVAEVPVPPNDLQIGEGRIAAMVANLAPPDPGFLQMLGLMQRFRDHFATHPEENIVHEEPFPRSRRWLDYIGRGRLRFLTRGITRGGGRRSSTVADSTGPQGDPENNSGSI